MSLKNWLFGSEEPGKERPAASAPSGAAPNPTEAKPTEPKSPAPEPDPKPAPASPLTPGDLPSPESDVEHTQILTQDQLRVLSERDRGKAMPIKFVPPAKKNPPTSPETDSEPDQLSPDFPEAAAQPYPAKETGDAQPAPVHAAIWKTEPVAEPWAPEAVAQACPELARHTYLDHEAVERILPGGWRVLGASRRGRKQAHDARFREDAMTLGSQGSLTVLAVADGAGSSRLSRLGSHLAVHEVVERALSLADAIPSTDRADAGRLAKALEKTLTESVLAARRKVLEVADKASLNPKEFRATLLTVLLWSEGDNKLLLSNQVGDGAIAALQSDLTIRRFGDSDSGAFSGEVSCFLTDAEAEKKAEQVQIIRNVDSIEALLLCSDGIEDPFYPIDKKALEIFRQWHSGVIGPLDGFKRQPLQEAVFTREAAAGELARWLEFEKRGENDDRTVLALHRLPVRRTF